MKYYETLYEDYLNSNELYNIHPELIDTICKLPKQVEKLPNLLVHGPSGTGKYTQVLKILKKYSPSELKYDKKITVATDKQEYIYHISDIHYEIDMSLLGCNSKTLWHEIFFQLVDIISVKQNKVGIIVCKNFHTINSELLEIFYSYMQQYSMKNSNITIKFILISEHISFLPSKIINSCYRISIKRPSNQKYTELLKVKNAQNKHKCNNISYSKDRLQNTSEDGITNMKEIYSFLHIKPGDHIPEDLFNKVCNNIITKIEDIENVKFTDFRDALYEILTYNIEINECVWYIVYYFVSDNKLSKEDVSDILIKCYTFLKYFNNNYRPIYHLENIMFYIIKKIYNYNEFPKSM
jgi:hypothetical protein